MCSTVMPMTEEYKEVQREKKFNSKNAHTHIYIWKYCSLEFRTQNENNGKMKTKTQHGK